MTVSTALLKSAAAGLIILLMSTPAAAEQTTGQLNACPNTPNCVSSQSSPGTAHYIAPIPFSGSADHALQTLKAVLAAEPRTTIVAEQGAYLHAEVRSLLLRFVDDLEFLLDSEQQLIHVRSASRTGYSDLGVNRRRVERIRKAFLQVPQAGRQEEGVIKFALRFTEATLGPQQLPDDLRRWRDRLWQQRLIGQQADRYGGYGYGNVSCRLAPFDAPPGQRAFLISGSQTGHLAQLDARHYAVVSDYDIEQNRVTAHGPVKPSSEALTHAMVYDQGNDIRVVLHVHAPAIWQAADNAGLAVTAAHVDYGTPQMAQEVARLFDETDLRQRQLFAMGGHQDGVIAFGSSAKQAGSVLLECLARCRSG